MVGEVDISHREKRNSSEELSLRERETDRQTDRQTETERQTDRHASSQAHRHAGKQRRTDL